MAFLDEFEISVPAKPGWDYTQQQWRFYLADMSGNVIGDLSDANERKVSLRLNRPQQLSFKLPLSHPRVPQILTTETFFVYAFKQGKLVMVAESSTIEVVGDDVGNHSIAVNCIEAAWIRLAKRLIGKSANGFTVSNVDRTSVILAAMYVESALYPGGLGVEIGSTDPTSTVSVGPWYFKPFLEAIQELGMDLYGFDHWIEPVIPTSANDYIVGRLHMRSLRGGVRDDVYFEYGDGRFNARSYRWLIDLQNRITHAISLPPTYPNNLGLSIKDSYSTATESALPALKRREEVIQNDLVDATLRQQLIDEVIRVRKNPRHLFEIQPHIDDGTGRVAAALIDYDVGDIIGARVKDSNILLIDAKVRIYGAEIEIDDQGIETVTLTVIDEE